MELPVSAPMFAQAKKRSFLKYSAYRSHRGGHFLVPHRAVHNSLRIQLCVQPYLPQFACGFINDLALNKKANRYSNIRIFDVQVNKV